jgi:hypothetical protein
LGKQKKEPNYYLGQDAFPLPFRIVDRELFYQVGFGIIGLDPPVLLWQIRYGTTIKWPKSLGLQSTGFLKKTLNALQVLLLS